MSFKERDPDVKLNVKEEESKPATLDASSQLTIELSEKKGNHYERNDEYVVKRAKSTVVMDAGHASTGSSSNFKEEQKLADLKEVIKAGPTVKFESPCKREERVKVDLEDSKPVVTPEEEQKPDDSKEVIEVVWSCVTYQEPTNKLEPSREVEKRVKIGLENNKTAFVSNKFIKVDNQTSLKDTFHERAKPEAGDEEPEVDPNDVDASVPCDNINAELGFSTTTVVREEEEENLEASPPSLQDVPDALKCEDEKKPKVENIAQNSEPSRVGFAGEEKQKIAVEVIVTNSDVETATMATTPDAAFPDEVADMADIIDPNDMETDTNGMDNEQASVNVAAQSGPPILPNNEGPGDFLIERINNAPQTQDTEMAAPEAVQNEEPEVIVIKDEPQEVEAAALRALESGKKRGRMIVEVVVDTYVDFLKRKKEDLEKIKKMANPKAQKIEKMEIGLEHILERLGPLGLEIYPITLDRATLETVVSRAFMSSTYGGNMQMTFPNIGDEHLAKHGLNDFMYLNTMYQPHAPQLPGSSGLFFDTEIDSRWPGVWRVFTRLNSGEWLFVGFYEVKPTRPLSKEEWASLHSQVQRTWAYQIRKKSWGGWFCARVVARQELGRKPTRAEWMEVFNDKRHLKATPEDIRRALATGEEKLGVSTMKCIGYDEDFQRRICGQWAQWVPPPPPVRTKRNKNADGNTKTKKHSKSKTQAQTSTSNNDKKRKRKVSVESELTELGEKGQEEEEGRPKKKQKEVTFEISDDDENPQDLVYRSRGTKSRPIVL